MIFGSLKCSLQKYSKTAWNLKATYCVKDGTLGKTFKMSASSKRVIMQTNVYMLQFSEAEVPVSNPEEEQQKTEKIEDLEESIKKIAPVRPWDIGKQHDCKLFYIYYQRNLCLYKLDFYSFFIFK